MTPEIAQFTNRGMNQDISVSKATNEFAFKNHNIRITAVNDNTLLSITNEKLPGDLIVDVTGKKRVPNKITIQHLLLNGYRVLLEYSPTTTVVIRITFEDDTNKVLSITNPNKSALFASFSEIKDVEVISGDPNFIYYYGDEVPTETNLKYNNIFGVYLGHAILNDYLVLFTKSSTTDYIYVFTYDDTTNTLVGNIKYEGDLNFSLEHPVETLPYYESEEIQKVYWVDGYNQPRVINIVADDIIERLNTQFDFNPTVTKFPEVTITKEYSGVGLFPAGVIQYFISYYNKHGAETGIVWASDLQYVTEYNRAAGPDETVVCSFKIDISNVDTTYDYARVYSMQRTSLNTTPICRIVGDININNSDSINIIDTNTNTETIDPTQLLFLGGDNFIASTLTQKDDVLFLGDLEIKNTIIPQDVLNAFEDIYDENYNSKIITFKYKSINNSNIASEEDIKTFKCGERYRFALQFQSKEMVWSQPIWIGDLDCNIRPRQSGVTLEIANVEVSLSDSIKTIINTYYINYRLLIAETSNATRRTLAQGMINPTVFKLSDRMNNSGPYAIGSWISRPVFGNANYEHLSPLGNYREYNGSEIEYKNLSTCEIQNSINEFPVSTETELCYFVYSFSITRSGFIKCYIIKCNNTILNTDLTAISAEQCEEVFAKLETQGNPDVKSQDNWDIIREFLSSNQGPQKFKLDYPAYKTYIENCLRGNIDINNHVLFPTNNRYATGYFDVSNTVIVKKLNSLSGDLIYGGYQTFTSDILITIDTDNTNSYHVDTSVVTFNSPELEDNYELFDGVNLELKIVGAIPIHSTYNDVSLTTKTPGIAIHSGLNKDKLDNTFNVQITNLPLYKDYEWSQDGTWAANTVNYNVYLWNKKGSIIGQTVNSLDIDLNGEESEPKPFDIVHADLEFKKIANKKTSNHNIYFDGIAHYDIIPSVINNNSLEINKLSGFNKDVYYQGNYDNVVPAINVESTEYTYPYKVFYEQQYLSTKATPFAQYDPVQIKYKKTPHLVFRLTKENKSYILPYLSNNGESSWDIDIVYNKTKKEKDTASTYKYPWLESNDSYNQEEIKDTPNIGTPYILIGEVCRNIDDKDLYGGYSREILEKINWIPSSKTTNINNNIVNTWGDTYYQRWECLNTVPSTEEDLNSVVDIVSFMVETHINLEGRYDKNKDSLNILNARPDNFNKINPVYSQTNNYFTYNILDEKFNQNKYSNQVAFSLQKTPTSEIDTWCNISLASAFNLDGKYGKLNKLITVNDAILAFQDKALSVINFNNRTAISTENGVPIEIANSGKVNGYSIISSNIGCQNKLSICEASSGVYFIDDLNKTMYGFNKEGLSNISSKGMSMWFKKNLTGKEKCFYDKLTNDVYITNNTDCLVYNEALDAFTSFMDYSNISSLFNFEGNSFIFDGNSTVNAKQMFAGDYTNNYYIQYKINPEPLIDKTFTNIEFIADKLNSEDIDSIASKKNLLYPFTEFEVWNEYQYGITNLTKGRTYPNFERKFRIWRADIPRDKSNGRDRIRNPWIYLKLSNSELDNAKMVFHSFLVKYYK